MYGTYYTLSLPGEQALEDEWVHEEELSHLPTARHEEGCPRVASYQSLITDTPASPAEVFPAGSDRTALCPHSYEKQYSCSKPLSLEVHQK